MSQNLLKVQQRKKQKKLNQTIWSAQTVKMWEEKRLVGWKLYKQMKTI